ncbi:MAG TPA: hypothetical protein VF905_04200 [Nitrospirota bacterium]
MTQSSLIDLSAVKPQAITKTNYTVADVLKVLPVYIGTLEEAVDLRFVQMQEMAKAIQSKIAPLPGQPPAGAEIQMRLQFLDRTINRLSDLIIAARTIVDYETEPAFLNKFPGMIARRQEVIDTIVLNVDKKLEETTHEEALLIAGYRDLERFHRVLQMGYSALPKPAEAPQA